MRVQVILDNHCTHKRNDEWLQKYGGRVQFHFTQMSVSWLNKIEIWIGILSRKTLKDASFAGTQKLSAKKKVDMYSLSPDLYVWEGL